MRIAEVLVRADLLYLGMRRREPIVCLATTELR